MKTLETEMREWLLECFSDEYDQEQIEDLTYNQLVRSIERYYDGGVEEFKRCAGWIMVEV